jgi:hypothetical protein
MKGYWIAIYKKIESQENLGDYGKMQLKLLYKTLEGNNVPRTVIWEFPSYDSAINCYNSKGYQDAWTLTKDTTKRDLQIIEGV